MTTLPGNRRAVVVLAGVLSAVVCYWTFSAQHYPDASTLDRPRVAHAGGGYNGHTATNSLQALEQNASDYALFEIDFSLTADNRLVCMHDWKHSAQMSFGKRFAKPPRLSEFRDLIKHNERYTHCTLGTLVRWLRQHPGKRLVTDVKDNNLTALRMMALRPEEIRNRIIPQIYHPDEYAPVRALGFKDIILTLYRWNATPDEVISAVRGLQLFAVTMPLKRVAGLSQRLRSLGVATYVHTINTEHQWRELQQQGITEIYTDWLPPRLTADTLEPPVAK